jgi:hypothetical protein
MRSNKLGITKKEKSKMNAHRLGLFCMLGGIAYIISAIYGSITGAGETLDMTNSLLGLVWALGAICGWLAIIQLRGTGENIIVRILSFIPILGLSLALISTAYGMFTAGSVAFSTMIGIGLLLEPVGALLVGIFVIVARKFSGWHRFAPLFVVFGVIAGGVVSAVSNSAIQGLPLFLGIAYLLLGYAVRAEGESSKLYQSAQVMPG